MTSAAPLRCALAASLALAVLGCGRKEEDASLLVHIPADTAFVFAATEPPSGELVDAWLKRAQPLWPVYETMLARIGDATQATDESSDGNEPAPDADGTEDRDAAGDDAIPANPARSLADTASKAMTGNATGLKIARELVKDLRSRDTAARMSETGLAVPGLSAFYGVGMMPVARIQLASADAFKAWVAKIENASGSKFSIGKLGTLDYWYVAGGTLQPVLAIQDDQLVVTAFPAKADEALRQRLLGITRPERSLADSGDMTALMKAEGYRLAAGWVDFHRLLALYPADPALVALSGSVSDSPLPALDAECRSEFESIVAKAPRLIGGYTEVTTTRIAGHGRWELAAPVAADLLALAAAPVAGGGSYPDSLFDMSFNAPILKGKDYALKQAKAIVAAPYRCESLKGLNEMAAESVEKLSRMLPPPLSDITGVRITIDSLVMPTGESTVPDVRGKLLVATENPSFLVGLAQMAVPSLASLVIRPDHQPVELPTAGLPMAAELPPIHVAMADKALAVSFGKDEAAGLAAYVGAPSGKAGDWIASSYSGDVYRLQGEFMARMQAALPGQSKPGFDAAAMADLYRFYAATFKRLEGGMRLSAKGIEFDNIVELTP